MNGKNLDEIIGPVIYASVSDYHKTITLTQVSGPYTAALYVRAMYGKDYQNYIFNDDKFKDFIIRFQMMGYKVRNIDLFYEKFSSDASTRP